MGKKIGLTFSDMAKRPGKRATGPSAPGATGKEAAHGKPGNAEKKAGNG